MKFFLLLLLFICCNTIRSFSQYNESYHYGLRFKSHLYNLDERTGLDLNPSSVFRDLKEGFSISFDIKFRKEEQTFGYVFRMISEGQSSFDFLSNLKDSELSFVINKGLDHIVSSEKIIERDMFLDDKWIHIKVEFFKNKTEVIIDNKRILLKNGIGSFENIKFYFGANKDKYFHTTEVPPVIIKNIKISDGNRMLRHWVLDKHNAQEVYDEVGNHKAHVNNGLWDINEHVEWQNVLRLPLSTAPQVAYDDIGGRVFIVDEKFIYRYNTAFGSVDTIDVHGGNPYRGLSRQIIYDRKNDELISYTIQSPILSKFSFNTNSWSESPNIYVDSRQHHNHILDYFTNQLYVFNGYAYHQYSGDIMKLNVNREDDSNWETIKYKPTIAPRYLSALVNVDSSYVLLLGGYGSKSGKQEEFPTNFYDLYKLHYSTGKNTKLWELNLDTSIVFSNSMYVDKNSNKIFVLGYSNLLYKSNVSLFSFDIAGNKPNMKEFESTIPFNFLDIESFSDLFFDQKTNKLIALLSYKNENNEYEFRIYNIGYPVFRTSEISQTLPSSFKKIYSFILVVFILFSIILFFAYKKRRLFFMSNGVKDHNPIEAEIQTEEPKVLTKIYKDNCLRIRLFDGVEIVSRNGDNCLVNFTPILKNIFVCILLHTIRNREKGISSYDLNQAFWQGMTSEKALNNRSVNMRKLRVLLASIGDIQVDHVNSQWILIFNEEVQCDFKIVLDILRSIESDGKYKYERLNQIVNLANGKLLPEIESEWVDSFKTEFNSLLIKVLTRFLTSSESNDDLNFRIKIADVILLHDSLEETAIIYKCNLLYKIGQKVKSKRAFDKYCSEYLQVLTTESTLTYQTVIERKL